MTKPYKTSQYFAKTYTTFTRQYKTLQPFTQLYKQIRETHNFTQLFFQNFTQLWHTNFYTKLYTTIHNYTQFNTSIENTSFIQLHNTLNNFYITLNNSTQLYTTLQKMYKTKKHLDAFVRTFVQQCTDLYKFGQHFTTLYTTIINFTNVLQDCTTLYKSKTNCTQLYNIVQHFTHCSTTLHNKQNITSHSFTTSTNFYETLHNFTKKHYTTLQNSPNIQT